MINPKKKYQVPFYIDKNGDKIIHRKIVLGSELQKEQIQWIEKQETLH